MSILPVVFYLCTTVSSEMTSEAQHFNPDMTSNMSEAHFFHFKGVFKSSTSKELFYGISLNYFSS